MKKNSTNQSPMRQLVRKAKVIAIGLDLRDKKSR